MELRAEGEALALAISDAPPVSLTAQQPPLGERIQAALGGADGPLTVAELQRACRVRTSTLCEALAELAAAGRVQKADRGYQLNR